MSEDGGGQEEWCLEQTFVKGNARHLLGRGKGLRIPLLDKGQFPRGWCWGDEWQETLGEDEGKDSL